MNRWTLTACALVAACAPLAGAQQVEVEEFTLDNGMKFLLCPRHDQPNSIAAGWLAKVGSANERPGITGVSHFFEHMMFKGTETIGTSNAVADRRIIDQLAAIRDSLLDLQMHVQYPRWKAGEIDDPWDAANDTPEMADLRQQMRDLQEEQREITVKDEFDQVYTEMGGSQMNAFTSEDVTFYFITVPSNKFELWAWMESDRLGDSVFREFYSERDVVHEERRLRTESTPTGKFQEQFDSMFWMSSPYNWPVIGWTSDLNSYTRADAEAYYDTYYRPNNLVGVIVGDFEPAYIKPVIQRYFSRLQAGATPPPVVTLEMEQQAEMRMYAEGDLQPQVEIRYHAVPFGHKDGYALEVLTELLNGRTGRLYKNLVEGKEIASSAFAGQDQRKYAGAFSFSAETKGDATPEQLEDAWYEVIGDLQKNLVPERELEKVKNGIAADSYRRLQNNFFLMIQLGYAEAIGSWKEINEGPRKLQEVTPEQIREVANKYFKKTNRSVAIYTRSEDAAPVDPELAGLDPQLQGMVRQAIAQIAAETDAAALADNLAQMEARKDQMPPQFQPAMEIIAKKARERLEELQAAGN
ncbi:MAG: insulinase family protein [Phycisphaeraceae bacterium]|nr:insulinase family protein [Phycisphaeraceae bacterium]